MSDVISTANNERDIETVTQEIRLIKKQAEGFMLQSAIEIGRRLQEVKSIIPHGEWGKYLQEQVEFSQSTANNMMKLAEEFGDKQVSFFGVSANSQALGNLSYTKALRLLTLPAEEREEFVETHDVENMSTRELERVIRERDEAKAALASAGDKAAAAETAEAAAKEELAALREQLAAAEQKAAAAKEAEKKAKAKVKELKENPEIPQEVMDRVKSEAESAAAEKAEAEKDAALADAKAAEEAARANAEKAQREAAELAEKLAAMEKQVRAANPKVTEFGTLFRQVQGTYTDMMRVLSEIDPDTAERLREAVAKMLDGWKGALCQNG